MKYKIIIGTEKFEILYIENTEKMLIKYKELTKNKLNFKIYENDKLVVEVCCYINNHNNKY